MPLVRVICRSRYAKYRTKEGFTKDYGNFRQCKSEYLLHNQAQKNTSNTKYPLRSTIVPATCEITASPRFWIDCMLKEYFETRTCVRCPQHWLHERWKSLSSWVSWLTTRHSINRYGINENPVKGFHIGKYSTLASIGIKLLQIESSQGSGYSRI